MGKRWFRCVPNGNIRRRRAVSACMPAIHSSLAAHMATHLVAMNLAAPLLVLLWHALRPPPRTRGVMSGDAFLLAAAAAQLTLLTGWHLPGVFRFAMHAAPVMAAMHLTLFAAALAFWHGIACLARGGEWKAVAALLATGKIVCLLGVLLVFAPRSLYPGVPLPDQQLAGLLMLVACPLIYVLAAIVVAVRWLRRIEDMDGSAGLAEPV